MLLKTSNIQIEKKKKQPFSFKITPEALLLNLISVRKINTAPNLSNKTNLKERKSKNSST